MERLLAMRVLRSLAFPRCAVAFCAATVCVASPAGADDDDRFAIRFEGGVGAMVTDVQRSEQGHGVAWQGSARLAFVLVDPLALELGVTDWMFPSNTGGTGGVFTPSGGLRVEPQVGSAGRFWIDAHAGVGLTDADPRFAFDLGMGFEFQPSSLFVFGPVVRYGQVVQPDARDGVAAPLSDDVRYFSAGLTVALRLPARARRAAVVEQPAPVPEQPAPPPSRRRRRCATPTATACATRRTSASTSRAATTPTRRARGARRRTRTSTPSSTRTTAA